MRLRAGDEFRDPAPASKASCRDRPCYRVTSVVRESPWWGLYEGKKVLTSYHFGRRKLEESSEQESLDVLLKTLIYPDLSSRESIKELREQFSFECTRVLGRARRSRDPVSNLLPEPIDYLRVPNDRDAFTFTNPRQTSQYEPILVIERVHGLPLDRWLEQTNPSPLRILRVLAALLDFVAAANAEGLLLNGPSPADIWVSEDDRPHFLGTDRILDAARQQKQRKLFPPDRYTPGFGPPEVYAEGQPLDGRADLYSWAILAHFLLTRDDPAILARAQGERFVRFDDGLLAPVEKTLLAVPTDVRVRVQHHFNVHGSRFVHTWPGSFLGVLRECLDADPGQRPGSREALATIFSTARPRPIPAALAIQGGGQVEMLLASRDMEPGLEICVRRGTEAVPRTPDEGQLIAEGALVARVLDRKPPPTQRPFYAVFTRVRTDTEPIYSSPVEAALLDLTRPDLLVAFAERLTEEGDWPARVALLEELGDTTPLARAWLTSSRPLVRIWAVRLLQGQMRDRKTHDAAFDLLVSRGLADEDESVRSAAVDAIFGSEKRPDIELVLRVATALGQGNLEASVAAARTLTSLDAAILRAAVRQLESERPATCPVCNQPVRAAALNDHLAARHGYLDVGGSLLPFAEALKELWRRLIASQEEAASTRLVSLFIERHGDKAVTAYRNAFEAQLGIHAQALGPPGDEAAPERNWRRLADCLAAHDLTCRVCQELLTHTDPRLRLLARLALVPVLARRLDDAGPVQFTQALETLCPLDGLDTRLLICHRLAAAGASRETAKAVSAALELDREMNCPQCGKTLRRRDEVEHLRRDHGIYEIDGVRLDWDATLARLLRMLLADPPNRQAAMRFVEVAGDRLAETEVVTRLADGVSVQAQAAAVSLDAVAALPQASEVLRRWVTVGEKRLGLRLFLLLGKSASLTTLERGVSLVGEQELPESLRRQAVELILQSPNAEAGTRERALDGYLAGRDDALAVLSLLDDLLRSLGRNRTLEARRKHLRESALLTCPACPKALKFAALEKHAWQEHRLVWHDGRWRSVWDVVGELLDDYRRRGDENDVRAAVAFAQRDKNEGMARLAELAAKKGVRHPLIPHWYGFPTAALWLLLALLALVVLLWLLFR